MNTMEISGEKKEQSSGLLNYFKSFDYHRTLPQDLSEASYFGAFTSFLCLVCMFFFLFFEVSRYLNTSVDSQMFIDVKRGSEKLQVNLDIVFPKMPCPMIGVDIQDVVGSHSLDLGGRLYKRRLDKNGGYLSDQLHISDHGDHNNDNNIDLNAIKQGFLNHEGCQIFGYLTVSKVPGNFHISSHSLGPLLGVILVENEISTFDISHNINHLSFGVASDIEYVKNNFDNRAINPLDGTSFKQEPNVGYIDQYFLQIVSATYVDYNGKSKYISQFTAISHNAPTNMVPAVYFKYDFIPMSVKYTKEREEFLHLIVQICAIIGGVFTIAYMTDNLLFKWIKNFSSRQEELINK